MARKADPTYPPPPQRHQLEVAVGGKAYSGSYWEDGRDIQVELDVDRSTEYAERRRDNPEELARTMLRNRIDQYLIRQQQEARAKKRGDAEDDDGRG